MELDALAHLSGLTCFIGNCINFFFAGLVLYRAVKTRDRLIYLFFFAILLTGSPWYPAGVGYIYWVITGNFIDYQFYVLLGTIGIPIALIAWLDIYMTTIHEKIKWKVLIILLVFSIIYYYYLFYYLYLAPEAPVQSMIGIRRNPIDIEYRSYFLIFLSTFIIIGCTTGIHFSIISMNKERSKGIQWKGRFLFISFVSFALAASCDSLVELNASTLIIIRLILTLSNFFYYIGFIMPKWVKKLLSIE